MLYAAIRAIARVALRWFYRDIAARHVERIPVAGPVILAANHNNALVDALLVASVIHREVRLTAKATLLEHPLTRVLVRGLGIVPLRRVADESTTGDHPSSSRNHGAFETIVSTLAQNRVVLIFPEGISHSGSMLAPLKSGCARIAIQAVREGVRDVSIVPIGISFEAKGTPRSRVALLVGQPIPVNEELVALDTAVKQLTTRLDAGLRDVTLNFSTHDDAARVLDVADTLTRVLQDVRSIGDPRPSFADTIELAERVDRVRRRISEVPLEHVQRIEHFASDLARWAAEAQRLDIPLGDVGMPLGRGSGTWFTVREVLVLLPSAPLAVWGWLNHLLPLRLAVALGRVTAKNADEPAMHTLVGGLGLVLLTYGLLAALFDRWFGWAWALGYLVTLPLAASINFWWRDRAVAVWRRARGYLSQRARPERAASLVRERARLRREAKAIEDLAF
ncbi:MAG: 1-acyl-sn-glycerol-3-phosphate acyltransferase [Gemmatimonadaceae bacterium]|nr:1-acyl-sn-glycerol-3-phosphate acyltransferase [Gemmatimonadaceae bacterium]